MCGIAGITEKNTDFVFDMLQSLSHRGPDSEGVWQSSDTEITLGHKRLSIVDLTSTGHQPMVSSSGRYTITYNGEIYNHMLLKEQLEEEFNYTNWKGTSDTEILLASIEMWGLKSCLQKLDGMFAFAIFDSHLKTLTLVRDIFGEKPLFFTWINEKLTFASQLIAIESTKNLDKTLNTTAIHDCLNLGYSRGLDTIYKFVYRLPAGSFIQFNYAEFFTSLGRDRILEKLESYKEESPHTPIIGNLDIIDSIKQILEKSVESRLMADVPVGVFLSGGIDSSLITAMSQIITSGKIQTYTIGFKNKNFDEAPFARKIADQLKTNHHELYIEEDEVLDRILDLPNVIDEPFGDTSIIPSSFLCEFARKKVTVALTGDGGDELFGGYSRYVIGSNIFKFWGLIPESIKQSLFTLDNYLFTKRDLFLNQNLFNKSTLIKSHRFLHRLFSPNSHSLTDRFIGASSLSLSNEFLDAFKKPKYYMQHTTPAIQDMMSYDQFSYLPDNILVKSDRSSMAYGLETRSPFLSKSLLNISKQLKKHELIHRGKGKFLLRKLLEQYLPLSLFDRPKSGFTPPLGSWLNGPLHGWAQDLLNEEHLRSLPGVDVAYAKIVWAAHCKNHIDASLALWPLLMYANWSKNRRIV